jgi:hypothetical protein
MKNTLKLFGLIALAAITGFAILSLTGCENQTSSGTGGTTTDSVTSIWGSAFWGCTGLTGVTIPDSVTSIWGAFSVCYNLASVTIPNSVISIGGNAFSGCNLASVTFQGTITSSGFNSNAFGQSGDLRDKYLAGGIGTYTRASGGTVWTKQ